MRRWGDHTPPLRQRPFRILRHRPGCRARERPRPTRRDTRAQAPRRTSRPSIRKLDSVPLDRATSLHCRDAHGAEVRAAWGSSPTTTKRAWGQDSSTVGRALRTNSRSPFRLVRRPTDRRTGRSPRSCRRRHSCTAFSEGSASGTSTPGWRMCSRSGSRPAAIASWAVEWLLASQPSARRMTGRTMR